MKFIQLDPAIWPALWRFSAGYWFIYLVLNCLLWGLAGIDPIKSMPGKLILVSSCVVSAFFITLMLSKATSRSISYRAILSLFLSFCASIIFVVVDHLNILYFTHPKPFSLDMAYIGFSMIEGLAIFFGWSCLSMMFLTDFRKTETDIISTASYSDGLTNRQREILALLLEKKSNKEIARVLNISPLTVRNHISVLFRQFGVKRRKDLADAVAAISGLPVA